MMKINKRLAKLILFLFVSVVFCETNTAAAAFNPAETFTTRCSGCHTIGKGVLVGPDLQGISKRQNLAWIAKFVQNSTALVQSGDKAANELFEKFNKMPMPPHPDLSAEQIGQIVQYIEDADKSKYTIKEVKKAVDATEEDKELGKSLFLGETTLANGGPNCISCHTIGNDGPNGGAKTNDLTHVFSKLKEKGLSTVLEKLAFSQMQPAFVDSPLTEEEAYHIKSFLYQQDLGSVKRAGISNDALYFALIGGLIFIVLAELYWRGGKSK